MFTTAIALYLVAVHGLEMTMWVLLATFLIDAIAWDAIKNLQNDGN